MSTPLESLVATGTKLWLDSVDPELVQQNFLLGATGATSNPVIISDLIKTGRFDSEIHGLHAQRLDTEQIAWSMTDQFVRQAQDVFLPVWQASNGNDGYVSFELDPLLEDASCALDLNQRVERYVALGEQWSAGHENRMIKVPATEAGLAALEPLAARGVPLNVTLIFTNRQYELARDAVWRGAQTRARFDAFKSVYSIFVSRVDVYADRHMPQLSEAARGQLGILNAKRIWKANHEFWADKSLPLTQEIVFASTGVKNPDDVPWKYVAAFAGSDIETNPPATNDAVQLSDLTFERQIDQWPSSDVVCELDAAVDDRHLEETLMQEGVQKFADPHKQLLELIEQQCNKLTRGE
jgi:transaldolase